MKAKAERFESWIYDEILPSMRVDTKPMEKIENKEDSQMPNELQIFNYEGNDIRSAELNGEPALVLAGGRQFEHGIAAYHNGELW